MSVRRMKRPGPLKDLPIDLFLPPNPNLPAVSRKRPSSPPTLVSPAKRRILSEEGFCNTPRRSTFTDVLTGPSSPAKRLDFGSPKSSGRLQSSSDDCFGQPSSSSLPSQTDPQSIHYPGFRVFYDPQLHFNDAPSSLPDNEKGVAVKENVPPRRKTRKAATASPESNPKSQLLTPTTKRRESERLKKAKSTPATPKKSLMGDKVQPGSPTPRRTIFGQRVTSTPRLAGLNNMRRLFEEEGSEEQY